MAEAAVMYLCGAPESECRAMQLPESIRSLIFDAQLYKSSATTEAARVVLQTIHDARICIWSNAIVYNVDLRAFHTEVHVGRTERSRRHMVFPFSAGLFAEWAGECTKRLLAVSLTIVWSGGAHANMLIIDKQHRRVEHFEPHGDQISPLDDAANARLRDDIQALMAEVGFANYTYVPPSQVCPNFAVFAKRGGSSERLGAQSFLNLYQPKSKMAGTCGVWSLWYLHVRLQNPDDSPDEALRKAMSMATNLTDAMPADRTAELCSQWLMKNEQFCELDFVPTDVQMQLKQKLCQPSCAFLRSLQEGGRTLEEFIVRFTERLVALVNIHLEQKYYCKCGQNPIRESSIGYNNALEAIDDCARISPNCSVVSQTVAQTGDGRIIRFVGEQHPLAAPSISSAPPLVPSAPPLVPSSLAGHFAVTSRPRRSRRQAARSSRQKQIPRRSKRLSQRRRPSRRT